MSRTVVFSRGCLLLLAGALAACSSLEGVLLPGDQTGLQANSQLAAGPSATPAVYNAGALVYQRAIPTPIEVEFATPQPEPERDWRPPPYPVPWALRYEDHFYLARPIQSDEVNWPHPLYRYGNTYFGENSVHTGVDLGAEQGAPVVAAGPGEVVWSGYGLYRGTYDESDPYGLAVAIRHDFGYGGLPMYTIYAHLQDIYVWKGQLVETGDLIGHVGATGHAEGYHLHFEVRLGENGYFDTRNPELWMVPPEGWAVLAGRIEDSYGRLLNEALIQIYSIDTGERWDVYTYGDNTINPDEIYRENFVISDLPAGAYEIRINHAGRNYSVQLYLDPGRTNFITFRGRNGFELDPTPTAVNLANPPY